MNRSLFRILGIFTTIILGSTCALSQTLASLALTASPSTIYPEGPVSTLYTATLTATGTYTNGSTANLTNSVTWTSADSAMVTVADGTATWGGEPYDGSPGAPPAGATLITASICCDANGNTLSASTTITVKHGSVSMVIVTPSSVDIDPSENTNLSATASVAFGTYKTDVDIGDSMATWTADMAIDPTTGAQVQIVSVSNGEVSGSNPGHTTVYAYVNAATPLTSCNPSSGATCVSGGADVTVNCPSVASLSFPFQPDTLHAFRYATLLSGPQAFSVDAVSVPPFFTYAANYIHDEKLSSVSTHNVSFERSSTFHHESPTFKVDPPGKAVPGKVSHCRATAS
jgi:hypothetical protein